MSTVAIESTTQSVVISDPESGRDVALEQLVHEIIIEPVGPQGNAGPEPTIATDLVAHYILAKS